MAVDNDSEAGQVRSEGMGAIRESQEKERERQDKESSTQYRAGSAIKRAPGPVPQIVGSIMQATAPSDQNYVQGPMTPTDPRYNAAAANRDPRERPDREPNASAATQQAQATAASQSQTGATSAAPAGGSATGAFPQMQGYDAYTQGAMGRTPQETMAIAQAAAAQQAQAESDAAVRSAVQGARTAGAMPGQAALAASGQAAGAYGAGAEKARQQYFDLSKFGATLGSEMSQRLARQEALQSGEKIAANQQAAQQAQAQAEQTKAWIDSIMGGVGGIAALFSDENLKEDIVPSHITDGLEKIKGYTYRYKGEPRGEAGVMAQDLERTKMAPAVMNTPMGKMVDTRRLSTMNTAALSEHENRLKKIEDIVKTIGKMPKPEGK